ncbi:MAG: hypothetical protein J6V80_03530, partial [Clostridia bacterium]|nr:hypothetical protein [Clostridia bacterium]
EVGKGQAFAIRTKNNTQLFLRLRHRPHSSRRDNFDLWSNTKNAQLTLGIFLSLREQLNLPLRASEVIFDSEVHYVSEVSPNGEVANLTSLGHSPNFTACNFTFAIAKTSHLPYSQSVYGLRHSNSSLLINNGFDVKAISEHLGHCNTEITSNLAFTFSMNTKPRWLNLSSTICFNQKGGLTIR